jgi:hypothetical protein
MMKAPPAATLEMIEAQLVLQFLIVAFDPPAQHGELDQVGAGRRGGQRREPVLDRGRVGARPLDEQPLFRPGVARPSSRWAGRTRTAAKRDRIGPRVPWRHVTVRHAVAGRWWATSCTLRGRWRRVRRTNVGGRPCPRYLRGGSGACPGAQTVVSVLIPTTYGILRAVSASRNAVTTP